MKNQLLSFPFPFTGFPQGFAAPAAMVTTPSGAYFGQNMAVMGTNAGQAQQGIMTASYGAQPQMYTNFATPPSLQQQHNSLKRRLPIPPSPEQSPEGPYVGQHSQGIGGHYASSYLKKAKKY